MDALLAEDGNRRGRPDGLRPTGRKRAIGPAVPTRGLAWEGTSATKADASCRPSWADRRLAPRSRSGHLTEAIGDQCRDPLDQLGGVRTVRTDRQGGLARCAQRHQLQDAATVGFHAIAADPDRRLVTLRDLGDRLARPGVQTGGIRNSHGEDDVGHVARLVQTADFSSSRPTSSAFVFTRIANARKSGSRERRAIQWRISR